MRRTVSGGALTRLTLALAACSHRQAPKKGPKEYDDEDLEFLKKKKVPAEAAPANSNACLRAPRCAATIVCS